MRHNLSVFFSLFALSVICVAPEDAAAVSLRRFGPSFLQLQSRASAGSTTETHSPAPFNPNCKSTKPKVATLTSTTTSIYMLPQTWEAIDAPAPSAYRLTSGHRNYGLVMKNYINADNQVLKADSYVDGANTWGSLDNMKRYEFKVEISDPSKYHRIKFRNADNADRRTVSAREGYETEGQTERSSD
eukprot:Selendium_serpulae@DN4848_c0_g2_i1.p1